MKFSASSLASLPEEQRVRAIRSLTAEQLQLLKYDWRFWARSNQLPPETNWRRWLLLAGRGFGKTRVGAQWVCGEALEKPGSRFYLIGATAADVRDVMIRGVSGILACSPPWFQPVYTPGNRRVDWPNGSQALCFSAETPARLRGPAATHAWADEVAAWKYPETFDQMRMGMREGRQPRVVITTTPTACKLIKQLVADDMARGGHTHITRGATWDNAANLADDYIDDLRRRYEGTRLGRQELYGEILDDATGALWKRDAMLDALRVGKHPALRKVVIGIDPATTTGEDSDETGIIVAGIGTDGHGYVIEDRSGKYSPAEWGRLAVKLYGQYRANRIVAERNQGGDLVESNIATAARDANEIVSVRTVHAAKAKRARAEPVAALYEQGRVHHVGTLATLEDQLCAWEPDVVDDKGKHRRQDSPDRLDALVYAITDLMVDRNPGSQDVAPPPLDIRGDFDSRELRDPF